MTHCPKDATGDPITSELPDYVNDHDDIAHLLGQDDNDE